MSWSRQTLKLCRLIDLGFEVYSFTWSNGRQEEENIRCRLDTGVTSIILISRLSPIKLFHLPHFGSDHATIHIDSEPFLGKSARNVFMFLGLKSSGQEIPSVKLNMEDVAWK